LDRDVDRNSRFDVYNLFAEQWQLGDWYESHVHDFNSLFYFGRIANGIFHPKREFEWQCYRHLPTDDYIWNASR
jgi:hypothetical protein